MALWKEYPQKDQLAERGNSALSSSSHEPRPAYEPSHEHRERSEKTETLIGADLTIEGKIEGAGHVRIAGRFKGDVHVEGDLTIEEGAHIAGEIRAETVVVAGEVQGNIHAASRVEFLQSGMLVGDLKAGSLTVAAGSRMRGKVEFGWDEQQTSRIPANGEDGSGL